MAERLNGSTFESAIKASKLSLVDFYSDSCIPCKKLNPILGDLEDNLGNSVAVYKVNVNFDSDLAEKYEVFSNPTLILFKDGVESDRKTGFQTYETLSEWIKSEE